MPQKDPDKRREFMRNWMKSRRDKYVQELGGKCAKCESTDRLEFDHIDRSTKKHKPSDLWGRKEENIREELAKCQLLCCACHKEKSTLESIIPKEHGTTSMYYTGCRCQPCKSARAEESRNNKARKKLTADGG